MESHKIVVSFSCPKLAASGTEHRRAIIFKRSGGAALENVGCIFEAKSTNALGEDYWAPTEDVVGFNLLLAQTVNKLWAGLKPTLHTDTLTLLDAGSLFWLPDAFYLNDMLKHTVISCVISGHPFRLVFTKHGVSAESLFKDGLGEATWQPTKDDLTTKVLISTIATMLADRATITLDTFSLLIKIGEVWRD